MTEKQIEEIMQQCVCGTRIEWTLANAAALHRGVVDEFHPQNGAEDAYLSVIEPGKFIPVLGVCEIADIKILV